MMLTMLATKADDNEPENMIRLLLKDPNADINEQNCFGNSALHIACGNFVRSSVGVELLLNDALCDVNISNIEGNTPLMLAVQHTKVENDVHYRIIQLLLRHPLIDLSEENDLCETALQQACGYQAKSYHGALLLIEDGRCDVNHQDEHLNTALMTAVHYTRGLHDKYGLAIARMLKLSNIKVNLINGFMQTALDKIKKRQAETDEATLWFELEAVTRLLVDNGAKVAAQMQYSDSPPGFDERLMSNCTNSQIGEHVTRTESNGCRRGRVQLDPKHSQGCKPNQ